MKRYSAHADYRCAQRNIRISDVEVALRHGRKIHRTGIVFVFLGARDIPEDMKACDRHTRLEGLTLLISKDNELITIYKNKAGLKKIRKKSKRRLREKAHFYPAMA